MSKSASRALEVLEYFGVMRQPLRAKHIAQAFSLHPSSADQLLKTMVHSGYLTFDPILKTYTPSPRLNRFAIWLTSECFWTKDIEVLLEEVKARTTSSAAITVRSDNAMRVVEAATFDTPKNVGLSLPLDALPGQAFLAACKDHEALQIVERAALFRQLPSGSADRLMARVRTVRSVGYAAGRTMDQHSWGLALSLPLDHVTPDKAVILGIAGDEERIRGREDNIVEIMRQSARTILHAPPVFV